MVYKMLKLSKKVEYAILAMQYMALKPDELYTAKQIAGENNLSYEFLAKALQILNRKGLINSVQGIRGGYNLAKNSELITIADVITALDQKAALVDCTLEDHKNGDNCDRLEFCTLKTPMMHIQHKINKILKETTIHELTKFIDVNNSNSFISMDKIEINN